jgi:aspartyl-tRNA(Asn)/glutamyl-tRNA(Gln) amidotransferase subunit A
LDPLTIEQASADLRAGRTTSRQLTEASLAAIQAHNERTNAFIWIDTDRARAAADRADRDRAGGIDRGPLHGVPVSLKDLIDVAGQVTSAGSRVLGDHVAARDATIVTRLREAGAVLIGKTNLHEFALGTTSDDSAFGPVRHPRDPDRLAGGSSGGSAVAVATGMGLASVGTDTGGSIRIPAAACGVVGLKPSRRDIPLDGIVPLSSSLDHAGPLATTVQDAAWLWAVLAGAAFETLTPVPAADLRLRRLTGYFESIVTSDVMEPFEAAIGALASAGAAVEPVELERTDEIARAYVDIVLPEAAHWHARFLDARRALYSPIVHERISSGRDVPAVAYIAARGVRRALRGLVDRALEECDALVLPTLPIVAPALGATDVAVRGANAALPIRTAMLRHTQLFNMTGHPAISIPVPTGGLPVGLQLVGRWQQTVRLLAIAAGCEKIVGRQ